MKGGSSADQGSCDRLETLTITVGKTAIDLGCCLCVKMCQLHAQPGSHGCIVCILSTKAPGMSAGLLLVFGRTYDYASTTC